jgi:hypothetical protein
MGSLQEFLIEIITVILSVFKKLFFQSVFLTVLHLKSLAQSLIILHPNHIVFFGQHVWKHLVDSFFPGCRELCAFKYLSRYENPAEGTGYVYMREKGCM